jgi:hypothetical protein
VKTEVEGQEEGGYFDPGTPLLVLEIEESVRLNWEDDDQSKNEGSSGRNSKSPKTTSSEVNSSGLVTFNFN